MGLETGNVIASVLEKLFHTTDETTSKEETEKSSDDKETDKTKKNIGHLYQFTVDRPIILATNFLCTDFDKCSNATTA
uniref:Uncharacterized protein n=1 Tax=Romanomermis culicivorax TaxID=13658 RepID=A0A915I641_ROMCU